MSSSELVHFAQVVELMCAELFVIFPHYSLNICGAYNDTFSFISNIDHLYLLSVFFLSVALEVYHFINVSEENIFGFTDFSLLLFLFLISLISDLILVLSFFCLI